MHVAIEITFLNVCKKVPDGVSDLAHCCVALKCCVWRCLYFNIVNINHNKIICITSQFM